MASLIMGGSERQMMELARRLPRDRFSVTFVVLGDRGPHADIVESFGVPVLSLGASRQHGTPFPIFAGRVSGKVARYVAWCRRLRFDIVDAWLFHGYGLAAITKQVTGVPILISGRRSLSDFKEDFGPVERLVDEVARRASDAIVANSQYVLDDVVRREPIDRAKLRVIRNGVEIPLPMGAAERARLRAGWGFGDKDVVVGCVANYKAGKGLEGLIDMAATLRPVAPSARYVFVGEGSLRQEIERRISAKDLSGIVRLHGAELDARTLYGAFDVVVQASEAEGLPNSVLEAAAAGCAIVATAAGGTPEAVIDGRTGLLVPVRDEAALGTALLAVLVDPTLRQRLGGAALEHVARNFGMDGFIARTGELYSDLAAARGLRLD
ncbi:MAG: glycosyltransferase [Chloroflexi bacterium]|nr:glycosyltransferase [Chloroflexota bacterium]